MKRTGFARKAYTPPPPAPLRRLERPVSEWRPADDVVTVPKSNPIDHEGYRRLVAALPCIHCGIHGHSQCAHGPTLGRGIKCDDRLTFPLCAARYGIPGCHYLFDQYMLGDANWRMEKAVEWSAKTRAKVLGDGNWPARLPMWEAA